MASLSEKSDPLASARARIGERLTDDVLSALLDEGFSSERQRRRFTAMRRVVSDALAPLLVDAERCDVCDGKGRVDEKIGCVCQGEGTLSAALRYSRGWLLRMSQQQLEQFQEWEQEKLRAEVAEARVEALQRERDEARELHRCGPLVCPFEARAEAEKQRADALAAELAALRAGQATCEWRDDGDGNWQTACGHSFMFTEDGPVENLQKFCGYCGGTLIPIAYVDRCAADDEVLPPPPGSEDRT